MLELHNVKTRVQKIIVIGVWIGGLLFGSLGAFLFFFGAPATIESSPPADSNPAVTIPPIDTVTPDLIETATFALG